MTMPIFCTCSENEIIGYLYRDCITKGKNTIEMPVNVSATEKFGYVHGIKNLLIGSYDFKVSA